MKRVYLDSNVLISLIRAEMGAPFKLMYQRALDFLVSCEGRFEVLLSDLCLAEIERNAFSSRQDVLEILGRYHVPLLLIVTEPADEQRGREIQRLGVHHPDSLHVALALKAKAAVLLTWNIKDFEPVRHLINVREPDFG